MLTLFKGQYTKSDYEYLHMVLDEILINQPFCIGECSSCENRLACEDLERLHIHVSKCIYKLNEEE